MRTNTMKTIALASTALAGMAMFAGPGAQPKQDETDPVKLVAQIQSALKEFQAANDERLGQLENRGEDYVTADKVNKINTSISDLTDSLDTAMKDVGRLKSAGGSAGNDNERIKNATRFFSQAKNVPLREIEAAGPDLQAYAEYRNAFDQLIRHGGVVDGLSGDLRNALHVGSDPDGGYLVPAEVSTELEKRIYDTSPMRQHARVITIGKSAWEAPYKSSKGSSGGWVGERQARSTTGNSTMGVQRIQAHEQYAYPEATQEMLDDAMINVESFLVEDAEEEMSRTENVGFVSGNGVMKPKGFIDYKSTSVTTKDADRKWGQLQHVVSGAAGGFPTVSGLQASDPDALLTLMSALHPNYRDGANFYMNRSVEAMVRKLKDQDGRYLVGFGDLRESPFGFSLLGTPVVNFEDMPDLASDSFSIAYANMRRGYYIIDRTGFRVLRDPYSNKPYVGFYITKRTGGDVRNFDAIKLMKFSA